ncbi:MAG: endolytic transglycosylase MltG [Elusimicrobia bacterium]|nr:endolytic transglycosylase MltG [Elusimicrobiota bacterium]
MIFLALVRAYFGFRPAGPYVVVNIPPGMTASQAARLLKHKEVIAMPVLFRFAAKSSGLDRKLKPGSYRLQKGMRLADLLRALNSGPNNGVRVLIPEGFSAQQVADRLAANGICSAADFLAIVKERRLEGYLFPTTYYLEPGSLADKVVRRMLDEFGRTIEAEFKAQQPPPKMTLHQLLTLASIIEREAVLSQERPMIAAVYMNRLRKRMRLEADPTVQYALGHWKKGLTLKDLRFSSPYNTYINYGLPPGPICSPSLDSFRAALRPAETQAVYFVADTTGGHIFSSTFTEHLEAKKTLWRARRELRRQAKRPNS